MSTMSLRLPDSLHKQVKKLAEKMSALMTVDYLKERAKRGSRGKFEAVLAKVPDVEPEEYDQINTLRNRF